MRVLLAVFLVCLAAVASAQQLPSNYNQLIKLYQDVISGRRSTQTLTPQERQEVLLMHSVMARSCGRLQGKCEVVCEAANQLEDAAKDLAQCAARHDFDDDCGSRARDVRDAADDYEAATSDAGGDCN